MSAEEPSPPAHPDRRDGEALLFDFFKHMTSLSLLTLGGVLTLSQLPGDEPVEAAPLAVAVGLVAAAGAAAFGGMDEVVKARVDGLDRRRAIRFYRIVSTAAFGLGIGAVLAMFFDRLY